MHVGEIQTDVGLVRRLLADQFPKLASKSIHFIHRPELIMIFTALIKLLQCDYLVSTG